MSRLRGITVILAVSLLALSACGGGANLFGHSSSKAFELQVSPDSYKLGGSADVTLATHPQADGSIVAEVTVANARQVKALYFDISYDPAHYAPVSAEPSSALAGSASGKPGDVLRLAVLSDAGTVHAGQVLVHPAQHAGFTGSAVLATVVFAAKPASGHVTAAAPVSDASGTLLAYDSGTHSLKWGYCCSGDYDQNGLVTISDLTSLAVHYGASGGPFDKTSIESVVDGDSNGEINIQDITPIGVNFNRHVESYNLYASAGTGSYPASNAEVSSISPLTNVPYAQFTGGTTTGRLQYSYALGQHPALNYWVRPADAGAEGTSSNMVNVPATDVAPVIDSAVPGSASINSGTATPITVAASDADGDPLTYNYTPTVGTITGSGNSVTYTAPTVTVNTAASVTVTVSDGKGGSDSAQVSISIVAPPQHWNFLVWVAGDNNLAPEAVGDLNEMEAAGSTEDVRVLAGFDIDPSLVGGVSGTQEVHFIKVVHDTNANAIVTDGDPANMTFPRAGYNSADPAKLRAFIDWANTNFPAQHTALVLWNHGDGWIPGKSFSSLSPGQRQQKRDWAMRQHDRWLRTQFGSPHTGRTTSGVLLDETNGDPNNLTNNASIADALSGQHFDVIQFDACNEGQIEALYDYRNLSDVVVGSECLVPGEGNPYTAVLNTFNAAQVKDAPTLGNALVDDYVSNYTALDEQVIMSSVQGSQIDALTSAVAAFASEVKSKAATEGPLVQQAISAAFEPDSSDGARDMEGFFNSYLGKTADASIKGKINAVLAAVSAAQLRFGQYAAPASTGFGIWLPDSSYFTTTNQNAYATTNFNKATGWLAMLQATGVPGGGGGGGYNVQANWAVGDYIQIEWFDPFADCDLAVTDPDNNYCAPFDGQDFPNLSMSLDSAQSGLTEEWGQLKLTAAPGDYYVDCGFYDYNGSDPGVMPVSVKLYDSNMNLKQDLGSCMLFGVGDYQGYAVLTLP